MSSRKAKLTPKLGKEEGEGDGGVFVVPVGLLELVKLPVAVDVGGACCLSARPSSKPHAFNSASTSSSEMSSNIDMSVLRVLGEEEGAFSGWTFVAIVVCDVKRGTMLFRTRVNLKHWNRSMRAKKWNRKLFYFLFLLSQTHISLPLSEVSRARQISSI